MDTAVGRNQQAQGKTSSSVLTDGMSQRDGLDFEIIEGLFFAYRDFISDPDVILKELGFGRAHHRILHFVNRAPGMTVAELLDMLRITKQSLARVLKELVDAGHIHQVTGPQDRRQRRLYPTRKGRQLAIELAAPQSRRIARALEKAGPRHRQAIAMFLKGMTDEHQA